ncbi:MAG: exonuclease SbcCD subunit D [Chloroflexi bacterium]|nr:exonuclease SbcCD subunit D [Chloroflexota bacterium]
MMSQPIRVLHFADVHIGMENYGKTDAETGVSSRALDFLARMDDMIEYARVGDVDLVIFAGDAFRSRSPNPTYQREFAARIRQLSQLAPTLLLVGNHDAPMNVTKASAIEIFQTLDVPGIWVAGDYEVRQLETKRGEVVIGAAPYPMRARLLADADTRGMTIAEQDDALKRALQGQLRSLCHKADSLAAADTPRLLAGHFSVAGAVWGSERSVMLGRDVVANLAPLADPIWDYVALGHIHRHQNLTADREDAPPVVYSGSLERIDFGEEGDVKGFCWVELARESANWRFVELPARKMLTLKADCRALDNPTGQVLAEMKRHDLADAVLRLLIKLTPESETLLNDGLIVNELKRAGVFHIAGISKDVDRRTRARLGVSPEGMTAMQLLARYFESRDVEEVRREELLKLARGIVEGE